MRALLGALALATALVSPAPAAAVADGAGPVLTATYSASGPVTTVEAGRGGTRRALPDLVVRRQVRGLENPWDVQSIGGGRLLITERDTARLIVWEDGQKRFVEFPSDQIWVSGETGLMSMEIDPGFAQNGRFYLCSGWQEEGGGHDVRVTAWELDDGATQAQLLQTLLDDFPTTSGRHGGCRLLVTGNGALLVGTGDAAEGSAPRDLGSLGGKTLRLDRMTGLPWPGNRFAGADNLHKRYVHSFGHRNIQGLAQRKDGSLWSVEHGPGRDDEVNRLRNGGDFGWHPVPGYDERVPMTDPSLPGRQYAARWRSGSPTLATSGATWVHGEAWGRLQGTLAVAALKAGKVVFMKFDRAGRLQWTRAPRKLQQFGRLRSVTLAPDNDLLITSDNDGGDAVIRVSPR